MHGRRNQPRWRTTLTTAAVELPLTLAEVKSHLGIGDDDESNDVNLMGTLRACTEACERYTRRSFINTTWTMFMDRFPGRALPWWDGVRQGADTELTDLTEAIFVPRPPLVSVTHIKAHTQAGTTTTVLAADYIVDTASEPGRIALKSTKSWPTAALRTINGVEVQFIAGYGTAGSDVPAPIRQALLICVGDMDSNREGSPAKFEKVGDSSISRFGPDLIPVPAANLLNTYKVWGL